MKRKTYLVTGLLLLALFSLALSAQAQARHVSWGFSVGFGPRYYAPPVYAYYPAWNPYAYDYYGYYPGYAPYYSGYYYRSHYPRSVIARGYYRGRIYRDHGFSHRRYDGRSGHYAPRRYDRRR